MAQGSKTVSVYMVYLQGMSHQFEINVINAFYIKLWNQFGKDTSASSQILNCDGVVLEIYLEHKFQWPQEGLNCESLAYEVVT